MILVDVNVLVYAASQESQHHTQYRAWLSGALGGAEPLACAPQTLASVIRILTHAKIWRRPLTLDQALSFTHSITSAPAVVPLQPGDGHWDIFDSVCRAAKVRSNLVMDAWLAALAIEHDCTIVTTDRDFARFKGLKWRHPLRT